MKKPYEMKWRGTYWAVHIDHQSFQVGPIVYDDPEMTAEEQSEMKQFWRYVITTALDRMLKDAQ